MQKMKSRDKLLVPVCAALSIGLFVLIWDMAVRHTQLSMMMPGPGPVFRALIESLFTPIGKYTLVQHTLFSLCRVTVGFLLGAAVGIVLGIAMGRVPIIDDIVRPIFNIIRPIPGVAWIPMAILWFGIGEQTKYFIIFMGGFANVLLNTYDGARTVDQQLIGAAHMLGASKAKAFVYVVLPASVPYIFAGLQVSLSTSWMAVLAAEMVSATEGVGYLITGGMNSGNTTQILIGMIAIGMVGLLLASLMRRLERRLLLWKVKGS